MIFNGIVFLITSIVNFLLDLLPDEDPAVTAQLTGTLDIFKDMLETMAWWFPVDGFFTIMTMIFTIELVLLLWRLGKWIASITPWINLK